MSTISLPVIRRAILASLLAAASFLGVASVSSLGLAHGDALLISVVTSGDASLLQPQTAPAPLAPSSLAASEVTTTLDSDGNEWLWPSPAASPPVQTRIWPWGVNDVPGEAQPSGGQELEDAVSYRAAQDRIQAALLAFDAARNAGPEAVLAFNESASEDVRAIIAPEVAEAQAALAGAPPLEQSASASTPQATPRVGITGVSCVYGTIQAAINAAPDGATIRVMGGAIFTESIDITRSMTIEGGYNATCSTLVSDSRSQVSSASGSAVDINSSTVSLRNLTITLGTGFGGGVDVYGAHSQVTLSNTLVTGNNGTQGGGIYVSYGTRVTLTNGSLISNNSAVVYGGGAAVYGRLDALDTYSDFTGNTAAIDGGGVYVLTGTLYMIGADMGDNAAVGATGRGGAIYADSAVVTLTSGVYIGFSGACCNVAYDGAGIYANNSRIYALGSNMTIMQNRAAHNGGGLYLTNGSLFSGAAGIKLGSDTSASYGNTATLGAGIYAQNSTVELAGLLSYNVASTSGGGIYATASVVTVSTGAEVRDNSATTGAGGAIAVTGGSSISIQDSSLHQNSAGTDGGAINLSGSTLRCENCVFDHNSAAGRGGAIAAFTSTVSLDADYPPAAAQLAASSEARLSLSGLTPQAAACQAAPAQCSSLHDNAASTAVAMAEGGGAVYSNDSVVSINQTYLHRNLAARGGAIYQTGAAARGYISNTLVYSNTTTQSYGAGIRAADGAITITHGTLANNTGGAGFSRFVSLGYIYDTIIWGNSTGSATALVAASCNIDQSGSAGPITNPLFISAGAGEDYRLPYNSPAVDACDSGLGVDIDNRARPFGARYDMGAYERAADIVPPAVVSITRAGPNPTSAASVSFTVTFSEAVTGVDVGDFGLTTTGVSGASVSGVLGSGSVYTVTVNTGTGSGTIRLDVVDNDTIVDLALNPLGGTGAGNGSYAGGEKYDVRLYRTYLPLVVRF